MKAQVLLGVFAGVLLLGTWFRVHLRPTPLPRLGAATLLLGAVLIANFGAVQAYSRVGKYGAISEYTAYSSGMLFLVLGAVLGCYALCAFPPWRGKASWGGSLALLILATATLAATVYWHGLWVT